MSALVVLASPALGEGSSEKFFEAQGPRVEGEYLVVFAEDRDARRDADDLVATYGGEVAATWHRAVAGAHLVGMTEDAARSLAEHPWVRWVEENAIVGVDPIFSAKGGLPATQDDPPAWGLDRIDQRHLPLDQSYDYGFTGAGVTVYVIDTGIRISHQEFGLRASWGVNLQDFDDKDCNGHGTHVAGIVGSTSFGVAKEVELVAVKALDCTGSGSFSKLIEGVEWVIANGVAPAVINISATGGLSKTMNAAVNTAVLADFAVATSAGNTSDDACFYSPAGAGAPLTVSSSTLVDGRGGGANWGECVDLFAPGEAIPSTWYLDDGSTATGSGTSLAAPYVAGVAALIREQRPELSASEVHTRIREQATPGVLTDVGEGSPNLLLHSLAGPRLRVSFTGSGGGSVSASPCELDCRAGDPRAGCESVVEGGATVTLTATPDAASTFLGWSGGGCAGVGSCEVVVDGDLEVTAAFDLGIDSLRLVREGEGEGRVVSSPPGIDCGSGHGPSCAATFPTATEVTLTAMAEPGSDFSGWAGGGCSGTDPCTLTVAAPQVVSADFAPRVHQLTVTPDPKGQVTSAPELGIRCGSDCTESYLEGASVTLTAIPQPGFLVSDWNVAGGSVVGCGAEPVCEISVGADLTVSVSYTDDPSVCVDTFEVFHPGWIAEPGESDSGTTPWTRDATASRSEPRAYHVFMESDLKEQLLVTRLFQVNVGARLEFFHRMATNTTRHGGVLEYSTDFGASWHDILDGDGGEVPANAGRFLAGGYTHRLTTCCQHPLAGRDAWTGVSDGWEPQVVDLGDLAGKTVRLRWRMANVSFPSGDWWIDDVELTGTSTCPFRSGILRATVEGQGRVLSQPPGIDCGADCEEILARGTPVSFTAEPAPGWFFDGWSNGCSGSGACEVVIANFGAAVDALFTDVPGAVAVVLAGDGDGRVTSDLTGIDCGTSGIADCVATYPDATVVTLAAVADQGSTFAGWSGVGCRGTAECVLTTGDASVAPVATFERNFHQFEVAIEGTGTVASSPAGLDCHPADSGTGCSASFAEGTTVMLTATPAPGFLLAAWSVPGCTGATCAVTVDGSVTAVATFEADLASCADAVEDPVTPLDALGWRLSTGPTDDSADDPSALGWHRAAPGFSGFQSFFTIEQDSSLDQRLATVPFEVPASGSSASGSSASGSSAWLRFWHQYDAFVLCDGAVLEYSTDFGATWHDIEAGDGAGVPANPDRVVQNGYPLAVLECPESPVSERRAWTFDNDEGDVVEVDLSDFAGSTLRLRWRLVTAPGFHESFWRVDDIEFEGLMVCPFRTRTLTVADPVGGGGTVASSPPGIDCQVPSGGGDPRCTEIFAAGLPLTLTATPDVGSAFDGWSAPCVGDPCVVTLDEDLEVTPHFREISGGVFVRIFGDGDVVSQPPGLDCSGPGVCGEVFGPGIDVTLEATASLGWSFAGWSGEGCAGVDLCDVLTDDGSLVLDAVFEAVQHPLAITFNEAGGTVSVSPDGGCVASPGGLDCTYAEGTEVTVTADPAAGFEVTGWSQAGCSGTSCSFVVDTAVALSVDFENGALDVASVGGTVTSSPPGIDCHGGPDADCSEVYDYGTVIELTAIPDPGFALAGWTGAACSDPLCILTLDGPRSVTALYSEIPGSLVVGLDGLGQVTSDPSGLDCPADCEVILPPDTDVVLTATPAAGWSFSGWSGAGCTGADSCATVTTAGRLEVTAIFEQIFHTFEITIEGSGTGRVLSDPPGIDCDATGGGCMASFAAATVVNLMATPDLEMAFEGWSGDCEGTRDCVVVVDGPVVATARFGAAPVCLDGIDTGSLGGAGTWVTEIGPADLGGTEPWTVSDENVFSPPWALAVATEYLVKDQTVRTAGALAIPTAGRPLLIFHHQLATESLYDGGVLEYSADGGTTWHDILDGDGGGVPADPVRIVENGYNMTLKECCDIPLAGRDAWSGPMEGWRRVVVELSGFAGQALSLRWRLGNDNAIFGGGWWIDDVELVGFDSCPPFDFEPILIDGFESGDTGGWSGNSAQSPDGGLNQSQP